ncbi:conserved hypothetical protein [Burkholderia ambifaria IOP40-10]|uniref:Phage tail protein n=1 Tax=Burkholderia ambifaria IOP40-10 TaxID=396596 RepID=B1FRW9_9BURK|nr:conserved hypothetical protein [Burkholderia ambifaria IOP40-10]
MKDAATTAVASKTATAVAAEVVEPVAQQAAEPVAETAEPAAAEAVAAASVDTVTDVVATTAAHTAIEVAPAVEAADAPADKPTLHVARPSQNELTLTVNGQSITLHPEQLGQLIEELAHARASMQPEPPPGIPAGWRFVTTKNPMMAVQKQSNGDRLLVARHTGYGWVPFTFSPDVVIQMYMMLTQR